MSSGFYLILSPDGKLKITHYFNVSLLIGLFKGHIYINSLALNLGICRTARKSNLVENLSIGHSIPLNLDTLVPGSLSQLSGYIV